MLHLCHVSHDTCQSTKGPVVFNYHQCHESAAAHLDTFLELLYLSGQCPVHTQLTVNPHVTHAAGNLRCVIVPTSAYG